tara:strand:- start:7273 stop:9183 length:1911 start_codon:yes stop_codon:yes gene_type:complete
LKTGTFDLEADGFLDTLTRIWCAVVIDEDGTEHVFTPANIQRLPGHLDQYEELRGHHAIGYDWPALRKVFGYEYRGRKVDTLLMSRLQRPARRRPPNCQGRVGPHSVEAWGYRLGHYKEEHDEWDKFSPEMLNRCLEDTRIQVKIYDELIKEGHGEGWDLAHRLNHRIFHYLQKQEEYGWPIDKAKLDWNKRALTRWIERIDKAVVPLLPLVVEVEENKKDGEYNYVRKPFKKDGSLSAVGRKFLNLQSNIPNRDCIFPNGDSFIGGVFARVSFRPVDLDKNVEVKEFLLAQGWQPEEWNTNNVGQRTSAKLSHTDSFHGIKGKLGKLIAKRVQCKQRLGTLKGWEESIREDGRIPAEVGGLAVTGRLRHKGIVNVPSEESGAFFGKHMRAIFTCRPGWTLVGVDSKGNQQRQLAARMHDDDFTYAVLHGTKEDGTDLHSINQERSGVPNRTKAKNFFYGLIFGAGDEKIGQIIEGGKAEGKRLKADYFREMPGLKTLLDAESDAWRSTAQQSYNKKWNRLEYRNGFVKGIDGRPIQVVSEHTILVYLLQSDEAIQMGAAYVKFNDELEKQGYIWGEDYGFVIWMHDEFQLECRPEIAEDVAQIGCDAIKWAGEFFKIACPHDGDVKIGQNWSETH